MSQLPVFQSQLLLGYPAIKHGFFTRQGGVSLDIYDNLNMAINKTDPRENVLENHRIVADWFELKDCPIVTINQIHSADALIVTDPLSHNTLHEADALITSLPNVAIGVLTADCVPVLVYAPNQHIIAAIHAGWKGAKAGIIANTIAELESQGARREKLIVVLGPCIQQDSYEVDGLFYADFLQETPLNQIFFKPSNRDHHYLFDLPGYVQQKLIEEGVAHTENLNLNTYQLEETFFSCRRAAHRKEPVFGNQISAIMLDSNMTNDSIYPAV